MPKKRIQNDFGEFKEFLHRPITDSKNLNKRKFLIHFQSRIDLYYIIIPKGKQIQFHILRKMNTLNSGLVLKLFQTLHQNKPCWSVSILISLKYLYYILIRFKKVNLLLFHILYLSNINVGFKIKPNFHVYLLFGTNENH